MSNFPENRMRRMRATPALRRLVQETRLSVSDLIYPMFVTEASGGPREIEPMPGIFQHSLDSLVSEVETVAGLGIPAVLVFGIPSHKDEVGSEAYAPNGIIQEAIRVIKQAQPEPRGHWGCVHVRVYVARALRHPAGRRRRGQRPDAGAPRRDGCLAGRGRRGYRRTVCYDGRAGRGHPRCARRQRSRQCADHGLLGQIRVVVLRPVQDGGRVSAPDGRPQGIPDGLRRT